MRVSGHARCVRIAGPPRGRLATANRTARIVAARRGPRAPSWLARRRGARASWPTGCGVRLQIDSEYDRLEAVLVHRPGSEILRLTHQNMRAFLFEDIPYLRRMQDEHDAFVATMRAEGIQVVYAEDLLLDIVQDESVRASLVRAVVQQAGVPAIGEELASLRHWGPKELVELLYAGLTAEEFYHVHGRRVPPARGRAEFLIDPIPNAYFARDAAVVVRDAAVLCKMHYPQRVRETTLIAAIFEHHPEFRDAAIAYGGTSEPTEDRPYTIEGGDVIILSPEAVLVGDSERTRSATIELLAAKCFKFGRVQRVYELPIPTERSFMHLDTVFNILDRGMVLWHAEVMENLPYVHRYEPDPSFATRAMRVPEPRGIREILADEFGGELTVVETAGGSRHFAAREQRSDGANAFSIAPRTAVCFERNELTIRALEQQGIRCIAIKDSELVRGLGGPRCMTMPLRRGGGES